MESDEVIKAHVEANFPDANPREKQRRVRLAAIAMVTKTFAKRIYSRITEANGLPNFTVHVGGKRVDSTQPLGGCGCMSLIILAFILCTATAFGLSF